MKKIGIITLFGYENYGNRLQMFAVQQVYKDLGFDSEIIKYRLKIPKDPLLIRFKVHIHYLLHIRSNIAVSFLKARRFLKFRKHATINFNEARNYIDPLRLKDSYHEKYSFLSVGSDQIWGWFIHPIAVFAFLKFAPKEKRIAFAPSFGNSTLDQKYREVFTDGLEGFTNLSVREKSGAELIHDLTKKEATILCDPTMCISKEEWLKFAAPHKKKPKGKYILTYFLGEQPQKVTDLLSAMSAEFDIVNLNAFNSPKYYAVNPSEWVDYFNTASLVLSDSFHGIVFSMMLQTPFAVYKRIGGESMQTRISHILEKFSMENRYEIDFDDASLFNLNFTSTEAIIESEKVKAYDFLKKALNNNY